MGASEEQQPAPSKPKSSGLLITLLMLLIGGVGGTCLGIKVEQAERARERVEQGLPAQEPDEAKKKRPRRGLPEPKPAPLPRR